MEFEELDDVPNMEMSAEKELQYLEMQKAIRDLEASLDYYADFFDFAPIGLISLTDKGLIKDISLIGAEMLGFDKSYLKNMSLVNFIDSDDQQNFYDHLKKCKESKSKVITELMFKTNETMWVELQTIAIFDYTSHKVSFRSALSDITLRKKDEEEIERLAAIVENSDDAIFSTDFESTITTWNAGAAAMYGYSEDEVIGKSLNIFMPEEKKSEQHLNYNQIRKGKKIDHFETVRVRKDGTRINVSKSMFPVKDKKGEMIGVSVIARDITKQKLAQEAESVNNERFKQLAENIKAIFYIIDAESPRMIYLSPVFKDIFGVDPEEIIQNPKKRFEMIHPDDKERITKKVDQRSITYSFDEEYKIIDYYGNVKWIHSTSSPIRDNSGKVYRIAGFMMDITERKKIEEELSASESRFKKVVENIPDVLLLYNSESQIEFINKAGAKLVGLPPSKILSLKDEDIYPPEMTSQYIPLLNECIATKNIQAGECTFIRDNQNYSFDFKYVPLLDSGGNIIQVLGIAHDITDRKEREKLINDNLRQKEILLKETHHRVKNNLQVIHSLLNLQSNSLKDEQAKEIFAESRNRVRAMSLIHDKLYHHSSLDGVMFKEYVEDLITMLMKTYQLKPDLVKLELDIDNIKPDMSLIASVGLIINEIVTNSLKYAFPENRKGKIYLRIKKTDANTFDMILGDDGIGLPDGFDVLDSDTLGLQLVDSLISQHEGNLEIIRQNGIEYKMRFLLGD